MPAEAAAVDLGSPFGSHRAFAALTCRSERCISVTRCLEGTIEPSRRVAWCRSMSYLTALIKAGYGLTSPEDCDCWLPVWLPDLLARSSVRISEKASVAPLSRCAPRVEICGPGPARPRVDRSWHLSLLAGPVRGHHSDEPSSAGHRPCRALQVGGAFASYRLTHGRSSG